MGVVAHYESGDELVLGEEDVPKEEAERVASWREVRHFGSSEVETEGTSLQCFPTEELAGSREDLDQSVESLS